MPVCGPSRQGEGICVRIDGKSNPVSPPPQIQINLMTTERKLFWALGILSVLIFAGSFFIPGKPEDRSGLPWQIEHPAAGITRVFGLTLGQSTAQEAEQRFREEAKPSLFKSPSGQLTAEMYFDSVTLAGLKARIVATVAAPNDELQAMYDRGLRISGLGDAGSGKKITLAQEDAARLKTFPVSSFTYMPSVRPSEDVFTKRFGQPAKRIKENKTNIVHWLYPENGLDIAMSSEGKPVLQYVSPKDFDKVVAPLLANGEVIN